jgi:hypothetical protein
MEILDHIKSKKCECTYWENKRQWHEDKNSLLLDIICLANNAEHKRAYLNIGIEDDGTICGIENDPNRYNQQQLTEFINSQPFAAFCPEISLISFKIDGHEIDTIEIKATNHVPYFLNKTKAQIKAGIIYSRRNDTNTGMGEKATPIDIIEKLFRIRFGIDLPIMERLHLALDDWQNWGVYSGGYGNNEFVQGGDWGNENKMFHRLYPEFRIETDEESRYEWGLETMKCFYLNQVAGHYRARIFYNSTELFYFIMAFVDEGRKFLVMPTIGNFSNQERRKEKGARYGGDDKVMFYYMLKNSIEGKVQKIITNGTFDTESRCTVSENRWLLIFEDEAEYTEFKEFAERNSSLYKIGMKSGGHCEGDEEGAHIPIGDTHNAYRFYVEFMILKGKKQKSDFETYFKYYDYLSGNHKKH